MTRKTLRRQGFYWQILFVAATWLPIGATAQQTNNSSTLNNSAAPSASSVTTGGTNINYQTNNAYSNENGFGPGIFCRTPTLYIGGNWGNNQLDAWDNVQTTGNAASNISGNIGILYPFGSSILRDCKKLAEMIAVDREISSQLSMLRLCDQLKKEGLVVDPEKFPRLKPCASSVASQMTEDKTDSNTLTKPTAVKKPKTTRS